MEREEKKRKEREKREEVGENREKLRANINLFHYQSFFYYNGKDSYS